MNKTSLICSTTPAEEAAMNEAGQLYNMKDDPSETNNLFMSHKDIVRSLSKMSDVVIFRE